MKKIIIAVIILIAGFLLWNCSSTNAPTEKNQERLNSTVSEIMDITEQVEANGITAPIVQTDVKSEINGKIKRIIIQEGDQVSQDQPLIEMDTRAIEAELDEAQRRYEGQLLRLEKAKRDFARLEKLTQNNYARESEFMDAKTDLELAKLELDIQKARLDSALDKRDKTLITAPHDGTVINLEVNEGEVITGANSFSNGTTLLQIADINRLKIEINLNEIDINKVKLGDTASLRFDAIEGQTYKGAITEIAPNAINTNNSRTFPITISINDTDPRIRPGISASIELPIARAESVVGVPLSAVFIGEDVENAPPERLVYIDNKDGTWTRRIVETGINDKQHIEIRQGLDAGKTVSLIRPEDTTIIRE